MARKRPSGKLDDIELLSTEEVCKFLGINRTTLYRIIERGELKARRIGRSYKVLKKNLVAFLDSGPSERRRRGKEKR